MKTIVIDDEPLARSIVKEFAAFHKSLHVVAECENGYEALKAIQQHKPDLIFLDVQMPKISGFELLELLENPPAVIFTTAFDQYALQAFEAHAVDYLLKPFSQERFDRAIQKIQQPPASLALQALARNTARQPEEHSRIVVKHGNNIRIIPVSEVLYIEAYDDYVKIHTADTISVKKKTMAYYEHTLPEDGFVRVHRSYLANVKQITRIEPLEKDQHVALLKNGTRIGISRGGYQKLREVLGL